MTSPVDILFIPYPFQSLFLQGGAVRSFDRAKKWLYLYPEASRKLLTALRDVVAPCSALLFLKLYI